MQLQNIMEISEQESTAIEEKQSTKEEPPKIIEEVTACSEVLECMQPTKRMASEIKDDDNFAEPLSKKPKILVQTPHHRIMKNKLESFRIKTIRECLHGIPPPPSLTNPRISIEEVIDKLEDYYGQKTEMIELIPKISDMLDCIVSPDEKIQFDTYYNDNLKCETLDFLYEKVRRRYIMNETCSFLSTAPKFTPIESPLSCDILDILPRSMSSPASPVPDTLSVELAQRRSRMRVAQNAQPLRRSPRKASISIKNPNLRMSGLLAQQDSMLLNAVQKEVPKVTKSSTVFIAVPKPKTSTKDAPSRKSEEKMPKLEELSETHQKKLMWATTMALKEGSPGLMDDSVFFKKCRQSLFRLCFVQWIKQQEAVCKSESKPLKGTHDRMLDLAKQLCPQVVESMTGS